MQCIRTFVEASDAKVFRTVPIVCNALEHLWRLLMLSFFNRYSPKNLSIRSLPKCSNALHTIGTVLKTLASEASTNVPMHCIRTVPIVCNALEHLGRLLMLRFLGLYLLYAMHWNICGGF